MVITVSTTCIKYSPQNALINSTKNEDNVKEQTSTSYYYNVSVSRYSMNQINAACNKFIDVSDVSYMQIALL